jgi:integrase
MALKAFQNWAKIAGDLGLADPKELEVKMIEYVTTLRNAGKSHSAQSMPIYALQKFAECYDIEGINFKKVKKYRGENVAMYEDAPYSQEELRKMVDNANVRTKAIILTLASTGIRSGALPAIRVRHLKRMENGIYKVTVYAGSRSSEYYTFASLEATRAIDEYLAYRRNKGETVTPDAPLFRNEVGALNANGPRPMTKGAVSRLVHDHLVALGIRRKGRMAGGRHPTMLLHGFRKVFATALMTAKVHTHYYDRLMGHNLKLHRNYDRLGENADLEEYMKAMDLLTVSNEKALLARVERMTIEAKDLEQIKKMYLELKMQKEQDDKTAQQALELSRMNTAQLKETTAKLEEMTRKIRDLLAKSKGIGL